MGSSVTGSLKYSESPSDVSLDHLKTMVPAIAPWGWFENSIL